jgi:hypothetical protein
VTVVLLVLGFLVAAVAGFALFAIVVKSVEQRRLRKLMGDRAIQGYIRTDLPGRPHAPSVRLQMVDHPPSAISDDELDPEAWAALKSRQERLPLDRLHRRQDWECLRQVEVDAAHRVADRRDLSQDQRWKLSTRHLVEVERRAIAQAPELVETIEQMIARDLLRTRENWIDRWWWRHMPMWWAGWPTWFRNRLAGMRGLVRRYRQSRFRRATRTYYQDVDPLAG